MNSQTLSYTLEIWALGATKSFPISAADFSMIRATKKRMMFGLGIEEKFDLVLENYVELERTLLEMALEHSVFSGKTRALLDGGTHLVNRRIANFLTTAKLYLDQTAHDFSEIYGKNSKSSKAFKEATSEEFDNVLGYRVMECLRNHAQHRGLPTHQITFSASRDGSCDPPRIQFRVVPAVNVIALKGDPKFKSSVLSELEKVANKKNYADLVPFIRQYAEALGRIHNKVRNLVGSDFVKNDKLISKYLADAEEKTTGKLMGLIAVACNQEGLQVDYEHLINRPIKRRKDLENKNQHLDSLARRYVSSM